MGCNWLIETQINSWKDVGGGGLWHVCSAHVTVFFCHVVRIIKKKNVGLKNNNSAWILTIFFTTSLLHGNVWVPDSPPSSRGSRPSRSPACRDWAQPPSHSGRSATPTIFNFIWATSRLNYCALHHLLFWQPKSTTINVVVLNKALLMIYAGMSS